MPKGKESVKLHTPYSMHRPARNMADAVRLFCLECMGSTTEFGQANAAVRDCPCTETCSLWPYRLGKDPKRRRSSKVSPNSLEALSNIREKRSESRRKAAGVG